MLYGGGFVLGWLLHRQSMLLDSLERRTLLHGFFAVVSAVGVLTWMGSRTKFGDPHYDLLHLGCVACFAVMMWSLVFLTVGVFQRLVRQPNAIVRFVADSSYWLYLVHLPIVVWLQVAVAELPLHWSIKLVGISVITILVALVTYDLFVRSTFIGQVLNGRRRARVLFRAPANRRAAGLGIAVPGAE